MLSVTNSKNNYSTEEKRDSKKKKIISPSILLLIILAIATILSMDNPLILKQLLAYDFIIICAIIFNKTINNSI